MSHVQNLWFRRIGLVIRYTHAKYESPICYNKNVKAYVKVFSKVGQRSRSRSQVQNLWYCWKGLVIRITHATYERLISKGKKVMANVKVFWRTDRQTDRVITIGHPPSGGALIITELELIERHTCGLLNPLHRAEVVDSHFRICFNNFIYPPRVDYFTLGWSLFEYLLGFNSKFQNIYF